MRVVLLLTFPNVNKSCEKTELRMNSSIVFALTDTFLIIIMNKQSYFESIPHTSLPLWNTGDENSPKQI